MSMIRSTVVLGLAMLSAILNGRGQPQPVAVPSTWEFAVGAPDERLDTDAARLPADRQPMTLPHRAVRHHFLHETATAGELTCVNGQTFDRVAVTHETGAKGVRRP